MFPSLGLPAEVFTSDGIEFYGGVSFLKAGIRYSDHLTTVSPSYAQEILTPEFGCGLDGLLRQRERHLSGILNGVDYRLWDPACDPHLPEKFRRRDMSGKRACKAALQHELGLAVAPDAPLIVYSAGSRTRRWPTSCSRPARDPRAGRAVRPSRPRRPCARAPLSRDRATFTRAGSRRASAMKSRLQHRLHAAADMLLHPSRFEPCGLAPALCHALWHAADRAGVGGLADTVVDANERTLRLGTATGFAFREPSAQAMLACIDRALALYRQPVAWRKMQYQAMGQDFGWDASAQDYLALYRKLAPQAAQVDIAEQVEPPLKGAAE